MSEQRGYPKEFLTVTKRLRDAFLKAIENEIPRAKEQNIPEKMFFEGALNTMLNATIRFVCRGYFPGEETSTTEGEERVHRMQRALSQALKLVLAHELGELNEPDLPSWPGKQGGHA